MLRLLLFLSFLIIAQVAPSGKAAAQATPDTSMKDPLPDSLVERRRAEPRGVTVLSGNQLRESEVSFRKTDTVPQPKRAAFYSAILPGAGQLYNKQYWKVPLVYAGVGAATYFLIDNSKNYRNYRKAYLARVDGDPFTHAESRFDIRSDADLNYLQDQYKQWLDLTMLLTGVGYILQVMDALTYSHLNGFDVSKNISMRIQPVLQPHYAGIGLVMKW